MQVFFKGQKSGDLALILLLKNNNCVTFYGLIISIQIVQGVNIDLKPFFFYCPHNLLTLLVSNFFRDLQIFG